MSEEQPADIVARHETQRGSALTGRERQTWRDTASLLAEVERLRALLAGVVADFPAGADSAALEAARAYLAETAAEQQGA